MAPFTVRLPDGKHASVFFRDSDVETDGVRLAVKDVRRVTADDRLTIPTARAGGLAVIIE